MALLIMSYGEPRECCHHSHMDACLKVVVWRQGICLVDAGVT